MGRPWEPCHRLLKLFPTPDSRVLEEDFKWKKPCVIRAWNSGKLQLCKFINWNAVYMCIFLVSIVIIRYFWKYFKYFLFQTYYKEFRNKENLCFVFALKLNLLKSQKMKFDAYASARTKGRANKKSWSFWIACSTKERSALIKNINSHKNIREQHPHGRWCKDTCIMSLPMLKLKVYELHTKMEICLL